jgi:hypothetical protein
MGRGPKPTKGKARPAAARKSPKDEDARVRDLEKGLAEARQREAEAQEQLEATAEILRIIGSSPGGRPAGLRCNRGERPQALRRQGCGGRALRRHALTRCRAPQCES